MRELSTTQAGFGLTGTISGTSSFVQRRNGLWFPMALRSMKNTSQPSRVVVTSALSRPTVVGLGVKTCGGLGRPVFREAGIGPAVICIHAGYGSSGQWRSLMQSLADKFHVIACDMSSSGKSLGITPGVKYMLDREVAF